MDPQLAVNQRQDQIPATLPADFLSPHNREYWIRIPLTLNRHVTLYPTDRVHGPPVNQCQPGLGPNSRHTTHRLSLAAQYSVDARVLNEISASNSLVAPSLVSKYFLYSCSNLQLEHHHLMLGSEAKRQARCAAAAGGASRVCKTRRSKSSGTSSRTAY